MNIAIIPARGGSKRIPKKNIKMFGKKPMVVWSIEAAIKSGCFDRIIVSTDDQKIADTAKENGAEVPFVRPSNISDDYTGTSVVVAHAIKWLHNKQENIDLVCCIYPTAPFIRPYDIKESMQIIKKERVDFVFSVTSYAFPIQRAVMINDYNRCEMYQPEMFDSRSQDVQSAFHDAGQFYWGSPAAWLEDRNIFSINSIPYILPRYLVQDIDTKEDWKQAEVMLDAINKMNEMEDNI